ncbi:DsbA family protein [Serratia fonticola]|uniref:DsbA family protein n=1 Tax=Serratia fonticola TaxID=47917 RepID=UPI00164742F3|nr:DsbA family protein [Serratia fonticola]MBC3252363.1 DsbA family protein [Serratia fonticola]
MAHYQKITVLMLFALSLQGVALANTSNSHPLPEEGREYTRLVQPVTSAPRIVEFFSFYCGPCYQFVENYPVIEAINKTQPQGKTVTQYHVGAMGALGNELTEAWAIAIVMGKTNLVEKPLFEAIRNGELTSMADIQAVFATVGIDTSTYDNARQSIAVKGAIAQQNAAIAAFGVKGTPSFYVNGKYHINNAGIAVPTANDYVNRFAQVVQVLLDK